MQEKRTEISELGEFGLIQRLQAETPTPKHPSTVLGIGDDAAVLNYGGTEHVLLSTDQLLEGIHFDLSFMPLPHLGYKAVSVNVSDINAMNGFARQITVSLGLSNRFSVEAVEALYAGIRAACKDYAIDLVGGDTTASPRGLTLGITAVGSAPAQRIARRSGAKKGDILCVTGDLGAAYVGLQILLREKEVFQQHSEGVQPDLEKHKYVVGRQLRPRARQDVIHELREKEIIPTAMIDLSDGLASDLQHIAKASGVGAVVVEEKLPIDQETYNTAGEVLNLPSLTCALNGGEDYELLFTIRQEDYEKIKLHPDIHTIGYITDAAQGLFVHTRADERIPLQAQGWQHFE